jgi:UDP-galactopyranose mutase
VQTIDTIIVGAGPAGLGVANHLDRPFLIMEKENQPGGLMRSRHMDGFTFDWAGHIFFTKIDRIARWVESLLKDNFHWQRRESWVYSKQTYTRYPFQANTYGLPSEVIKECLLGLIEATYQPNEKPPTNFREWIYHTYGEGIARHFLIPYNEKIWARDPSTMDFQWLGGRVPRPGLSEFIDGALGPGRKDMGPNARFGYPLKGGTEALVKTLTAPIQDQLLLNTHITAIDPENRTISTQSGDQYAFKNLVLTAPLTEILTMTQGVPEDVSRASRDMEKLSVLCVNIGVEQQNPTGKHWIYFPESEFLFHRIFVQGNASPWVCPDGCFSYTAEITYSETKKISFGTAGDQTIQGMIQAGLITEKDKIRVVDLIDIPIGYVIPTHNRGKSIALIRDWYRQFDIHLVGRFAEWAYYNMDHSLDAGWTKAKEISGE